MEMVALIVIASFFAIAIMIVFCFFCGCCDFVPLGFVDNIAHMTEAERHDIRVQIGRAGLDSVSVSVSGDKSCGSLVDEYSLPVTEQKSIPDLEEQNKHPIPRMTADEQFEMPLSDEHSVI